MTAVEWLLNHIDIKFIGNTDKYIEKAKEMEREQIIDAWENGYREFYDGSSTPEEYYSGIFKSE